MIARTETQTGRMLRILDNQSEAIHEGGQGGKMVETLKVYSSGANLAFSPVSANVRRKLELVDMPTSRWYCLHLKVLGGKDVEVLWGVHLSIAIPMSGKSPLKQ
ncbi:hypothetical protein TcWFU_006944 [Taenia crassiceps]|uniref:Uncharacterized protein n=1 Tax=Taenia crassiceps TaxID=6207 RepID=A0ABR4PZE3_9CEST